MSHIWSYDSSSNMHEPKKRFELFVCWFGCRRLAILVCSCGACTWREPGPLKHPLLPCRAITIDKSIHVSSFDLVGWVTRGACTQQHIPHGQLGKLPWRLSRNGFYEPSDLGAVPVRPQHSGPKILARTCGTCRRHCRGLIAPLPFVIFLALSATTTKFG